MGVVTINFIEVGSLLFEVTKNFRLFQKIMKRLLRGSSSLSSKVKQKEEEQKPKFNLPRTAEDRPCEWPSENFMNQVGIKEEFSTYLSNAGLEDFEADKCPQYHDLTSSFVRRFEFSSSRNSPSVMFDL